MTLEHIREHCLKKKFVTEEFPFGETTFVYKVMGKMFLLTNLDPPLSINIKCEPEQAIELRERYESVQPGYHMNKKHWNTVDVDGSVPEKLIFKWIDDSYDLVVQSLPKVKREKIKK
jgi:predicted DNA-binding protein (MmcQ/YjbR family)